MSETRFVPPGADSGGPVPALDDDQRAVLDLDVRQNALVVGAPGTGKTTALTELLADRVIGHGWEPSGVLTLTTSRTAATALRDRLALRLAVPTNGPLSRTVNSLAFDIVASAARAAGGPSPTLLTGGEQDSDFAQLLAGQLEDGTCPAWPELLAPHVRAMAPFRTELRELFMRATEYGVDPSHLRHLGEQHERPEWTAAADFFDDYLAVVGSARPGQLDSAELVQFAVRAIRQGNPGPTAAALRLVVVDDVQEFTTSGMALLSALAARGVAVVAFGDPDVAVNAFRGGEPDVLGRFARVLARPAVTLRLGTAYRQGPALRAMTQRVTERIGTAGIVGQRRAPAAGVEHPDAVVRVEAESPAREWATIARAFREHHLLGGLRWSDMAVIVRSGAQVPLLVRALALADVPSRSATAGRPVRDDAAARELLTLVDVAVGRSELTAEVATGLLLGPFGGLDRLALRRLRLALRAEELAGGGARPADELLVEALHAPERLATVDSAPGRKATRMAATLSGLRNSAEAGATIEELLWSAWQRSSLASLWSGQAAGSGIIAAQANRNLDGVLALFTAAKRFVERDPSAGATVFLTSMLDAEVPEDTLSPQAAVDSVLVTTPQGALGREFEVVAVAGVQDGIWPNLRVRGSLLYPQQLVRVLTGLADAELDERATVLADELRMFALSVSRARRQVIVAAVSNEDEAPSAFFGLLPPDAPLHSASGRPPFSLRGLTGRLRRDLTDGPPSVRADAASALARLGREGVPGADPADWHGLLEPSTTEPMYRPEEIVPISPSRLQAFEESGLDWFVETVAGSTASTAMGIGTIVHWAMETAGDCSLASVWAAIEQRWRELAFESNWVGEQQKRAARILAAGVAEYLADFEREGKRLVGAEKRFGLELERARINGSIDRVERSADGSVVIVDLKTGTPIAAKEIADHPQLGAYQLAYASGVLDTALEETGTHSAGGAKLLFVKRGVNGKLYRESVQAAFDEAKLDAFRARVLAAAEQMSQAQFSGPAEPVQQYGPALAARELHRVKAVSSD